MELGGLTTVNLELSSLCNKSCWMCGRRKIDREYPHLAVKYDFMDLALARKVAEQVPEGIVVQFHNNGEPLLYPNLGEALSMFDGQIRCLDTNGKLLLEKKDEIIGRLDTITVSTFQGDAEADHQYDILGRFLAEKGSAKPLVIIRCLGDIEPERRTKYEGLGCIIADRVLHSPMGSFGYSKKTVVPEIGICLEILTKLAINVDGEVSICVRFDPERLGVLGNVRNHSLDAIWNGKRRKDWIGRHLLGRRADVPLCSKCEFWGIPRG